MWSMFLDDERLPLNDEWWIARTVEQAKYLIGILGTPQFISFDHDLGTPETGYDLAKWLVEQDLDNCYFLPKNFDFYVHSQNVVGAENIRSLLKRYLEIKG